MCVLQARLCNGLSSLVGVATMFSSVMDTLPSSLLEQILCCRGHLGCPLMLAVEGVLDPPFCRYFATSCSGKYFAVVVLVRADTLTNCCWLIWFGRMLYRVMSSLADALPPSCWILSTDGCFATTASPHMLVAILQMYFSLQAQ